MIIIILFCTLLFPIQIVMTSASKRTKLIYTYSFSCNKKAQRAQTQLFLLDYDKDDDNHAEVDAFLLFFYSVAILHQYGAWTEAAPAAATIIRATTSGTSKWIPIQKKWKFLLLNTLGRKGAEWKWHTSFSTNSTKQPCQRERKMRDRVTTHKTYHTSFMLL